MVYLNAKEKVILGELGLLKDTICAEFDKRIGFKNSSFSKDEMRSLLLKLQVEEVK